MVFDKSQDLAEPLEYANHEFETENYRHNVSIRKSPDEMKKSVLKKY